MHYLQLRECMVMQGYYFSKPLPAKEATSYLNRLLVNE
ncbi:hypothetical protein [Tetzosporium hominis]|nr:hypothetical protein [Tetzosporium hominis]